MANIADDLIVHGWDSEEHDSNLIKVLERLKERGLTVNAKKCTKFRMTKVVFMGLLLTRHGIGPTKKKVRAVVEASQSPSEVRSFLGLVGFSAWFIPYFSTTADPLKIARRRESFIWGEEQEKSFQKLKRQIASAPVLAYFDKGAHTQIIADVSPVRLGAVLVQERNGERRAVCCASRPKISNVEGRYSRTEREPLALVWACERFHLYVHGLPKFDLVTDHEALKVIYLRKSKPSARIERWVLRLQPYNC